MARPAATTRMIELTPAGRAAVAVVLVEGPDAVGVVDACFERSDGRRLGEFPTGRILVGRWGAASGEELVVCRRSDDRVEIHCHGGAAAVRAVADRLRDAGCESMPWQDWLRVSSGDPIRAAAQIALAEAPTARTAAILLDQFDGALATAIKTTLAAATAGDWSQAMAMIESVLAQRGVGRHLTTPWRVVLAGRSNVGKSSLLNALVGFERAIVCDVPGTTRDVVTANTAIDGWPTQLADTAGVRETSDAIESQGVARAVVAISEADLVLMVEDGSGDGEAAVPSQARVLRVLNKIDLAEVSPFAKEPRFDARTSAVTGEGIAALVGAIGSALVPEPPDFGTAVPFTAEQIERLEAALAAANQRDAAVVVSNLRPLV